MVGFLTLYKEKVDGFLLPLFGYVKEFVFTFVLCGDTFVLCGDMFVLGGDTHVLCSDML